MTWIRRIDYPDSTGYLRELYDRVKGPAGNIDNVMKAHCLRPHTMEGHGALYKSIMHHSGNTLPAWLLEAVGVHTSLLNGCDYAVAHHYAGLRRQLSDDARADAIWRALAAGRPEDAFDGRDLAFLRYAAKLTRAPADMTEADVAAVRDAGADDGEIFEVNQVCAYFNYSNRLLNGLGITTDGDILGESPPETDDITDWRHE